VPLLTLLDASLAYGLHPLLDGASLGVESGERIGLLGRNGTGKSTLLRAIAGEIALDEGEVRRSDGLRIAFVEQEPALPDAPTVRQSLALRGRLESIADERERWRTEARLDEFMHRLALDGSLAPAAASGGETKRAALALALALEPQLLLLDEPTNHLDLDGIRTLEELLLRGPTTIFVTHDRAFLRRLAGRIIELDQARLVDWACDYTTFLARKQAVARAGARGQQAGQRRRRQDAQPEGDDGVVAIHVRVLRHSRAAAVQLGRGWDGLKPAGRWRAAPARPGPGRPR